MYRNYFKRAFDIVFATVFLLAFSWLVLFIIFAFYLLNDRPVFFFQTRIGYRNKCFELVKFRSLKVGEGNLLTRRTRWGNFLRATSLDELPQLWLVLIGNMSLVGPRPLPTAYLIQMTEQQKQRHNVRPGITGLTQVSGRHKLPWERKFELDLLYSRQLSLALDLKIIFKTIVLLLSFKKDHSLEEPPFRGN